MTASDRQQLPLHLLPVDGRYPEALSVRLRGSADGVARPVRLDDEVVLLVRARATATGIKRTKDDMLVRTVTLDVEYVDLLHDEVLGLLGRSPTVAELVDAAAASSARDQAVAAGVETLPLDAYFGSQPAAREDR